MAPHDTAWHRMAQPGSSCLSEASASGEVLADQVELKAGWTVGHPLDISWTSVGHPLDIRWSGLDICWTWLPVKADFGTSQNFNKPHVAKSPPLSPGILEASKELEEIIQAPMGAHGSSVKQLVLDYLMDVKSGLLADAFADDRKLEFFKNHAKKTKAILELFDKWGKHYELAGASSGGAKITATWKELMKEMPWGAMGNGGWSLLVPWGASEITRKARVESAMTIASRVEIINTLLHGLNR
eukprot:Skav234791  [mRNA]  locus=scaffold69:115519:121154:+ [translate_table: standard]